MGHAADAARQPSFGHVAAAAAAAAAVAAPAAAVAAAAWPPSNRHVAAALLPIVQLHLSQLHVRRSCDARGLGRPRVDEAHHRQSRLKHE